MKFIGLLIAALVLAIAGPVTADNGLMFGVYTGGPGYVPPTITNGLAIAFGDSRVANGGIAPYTGTTGGTYISSIAYSNTWSSEVPAFANNAIKFSETYNYGVGAQSSAGIRARYNTAAYWCNFANGSSSSGACWSGVNSTTSGSTTSGSTALTISTSVLITGGVQPGWYVYFNNASYGAANLTVSSVTDATHVVLSAGVSSTVPSGTSVVFSPPSNTNQFYNFIGGSSNGYTITDPEYSILSNALYSACSDPAKMVLFMTGTNDGPLVFTAGTPQPLINQAAIFDALGPSGCNKVVIAGAESPKGLATAIGETHIAAASVAVTNAATFFDDQGVYYAPTAVSNAPGSNDGTALTKVSYPCGAVTTGQYCVNSGTYYFGGTDVSGSAKMMTYYRWMTPTNNSYLTTIHNWLNSSSCGSFTDPATLTTYSISGAQCNRPWLKVVDTWTPVLDSATSTSLGFPVNQAFSSIDGLHPLTAYGTMMAKAFKSAVQSYVGTTPVIAPPTANNVNFTSTTSNSGSCTGTCSTSTCNAIAVAEGMSTNAYYLTALSPAASTGVFGSAGASNFYVTMNNTSATGIPAKTKADCVDTTNNVVHLQAPATAAIVTANDFAAFDTNSIMLNGLFDHRLITTTAVTNCNTHCGTPSLGTTITQGYPAPGSFTLAAGNNTDLTAGTLIFNYGMETNPFSTGYDAFTMQVGGYATSALAATLQIGPLNASIASQVIASGDAHRAVCTVAISAGANGHLWGVYTPMISLADTTATQFTPPNAALTNYTNMTARIGSGGAGIELTDKDLALNGVSGVITETLISPIVRTAQTPYFTMVSPNSQIQIIWQSDAGVPVSGTVRVQQCAIEKVTS